MANAVLRGVEHSDGVAADGRVLKVGREELERVVHVDALPIGEQLERLLELTGGLRAVPVDHTAQELRQRLALRAQVRAVLPHEVQLVLRQRLRRRVLHDCLQAESQSTLVKLLRTTYYVHAHY